MMKLTRKKRENIQFLCFRDTRLETVDSIKNFEVTMTTYLRRNVHISNVCTKANHTLGLLRQNLGSCPRGIRKQTRKALFGWFWSLLP